VDGSNEILGYFAVSNEPAAGAPLTKRPRLDAEGRLERVSAGGWVRSVRKATRRLPLPPDGIGAFPYVLENLFKACNEFA